MGKQVASKRRLGVSYLEKEAGATRHTVVPTVNNSGRYTGINLYYPGGYIRVLCGPGMEGFFKYWDSRK